jgi:hypothetical protein
MEINAGGTPKNNVGVFMPAIETPIVHFKHNVQFSYRLFSSATFVLKSCKAAHHFSPEGPPYKNGDSLVPLKQ